MNKKVVVAVSVALIAAGMLTGGTMAAYQAVTQTDKTISTSSLDVKLKIDGGMIDSNGNVTFLSSEITEGEVKEKVAAFNSGNKDQYIRVRINKAWYDNNIKIYEKNKKNIDSRYIGINLINLNDWIELDGSDNNGEDIYIYYKKILRPGEVTESFMNKITLFDNVFENTNQYGGLSVKVRFDADAVQTTAVKETMLSEWGVLADFDSEGKIISLKNQ